MKKIVIAATVLVSSLGVAAQVNSPADGGYCCRGMLMYQDKNYVGCIDQMMYLKSQSPTPDELEKADYYVAMSSAHLGRTDAAGLLTYFLWQHPDSERCLLVRLMLGNLKLDAGEYGDALSIYDKINADALDREHAAELNFNTAYCLLKRGEYDRADALYGALTSNSTYGNASRFYQGYIRYVKKDYRSALAAFKNVNTAVAPGNMADYYMAQIYYIEGDYRNAAAKAKSIVNRSDVAPEFSAEASRIAGESLYELGDDAAAIPYLRKYVDAVESPLPSALYILGVTDYREGDYRAAITHLTPVASLDNAMGQSANLFIGQAYMQQANYSSAMIAFDKALKMDFDPEVRETAYYNYAVANTQGGRVPFGGSVSVFENFLATYPNSRYAPQIREYIVTGYMTDNDYASALASINAIKSPSNNILKAKQQVLYTLGTRELATGDPKSAISYLQDAAKLASYNPKVGAETNLWLGEALYADGRYSDAADKFLAYLADSNLSKQNKPIALYDLGYARFSDERYDDAAVDFRRFLANPGSLSKVTIADAYNRLGDCLYYNTKFDEAVEAYNNAYSASPETGDYAVYQKAMMKGLQRNYSGKIDDLLGMMKDFPASSLTPSALVEIGESYDLIGKHDQAIESYSLAAARYSQAPQGRQASLLLALTYLNNGDRPQAISTYKNLISNYPTSAEARQADENLRSILADDGRLAEYEKFMATVPEFGDIDISDLEASAFGSAEREYLNNGTSGRLVEYLDRFTIGSNRPQALAYLVEASNVAGNSADVEKYAVEMLNSYPDSELLPDALMMYADERYDAGAYEKALDSYKLAGEKTSSPALSNSAKLGAMRASVELGELDGAIAYADALTASSTITHEQRSEAVFLRGLAYDIAGNTDSARADWESLSGDLSDFYGVMSLYYLADQQLRLGNLAKAEELGDKLLSAELANDYWFGRSVILYSDIKRAQGDAYEAEALLTRLQEQYPDDDTDIIEMINERLEKK